MGKKIIHHPGVLDMTAVALEKADNELMGPIRKLFGYDEVVEDGPGATVTPPGHAYPRPGSWQDARPCECRCI